MEQSEERYRTAIWPLGDSRATTIPPRILTITQAPDGDDAEVRWKYDDERPPNLYVEFGRASDVDAHDQYAYRTTVQKRSDGSRATTIPADILRHDAEEGVDEVVWRFDLKNKHPVRPIFTISENDD